MEKAYMNGVAQRKLILEFVDAYHRKNGFAPSITEISAEVGTVRSNVHRHLHILEQEGRLTSRVNMTRSWVVKH